MAKREVIVIEKDVKIAENVFLCKGDTIVESGKGRWTIYEADDKEDDEDKEDKKEEMEDDDEDDDEEEVVEKKKKK